ncbi:MAG TPA: hypothetical protein VN200_10480 [Rhodoglobus sp.]|nr:hypothetical protein [Rhodoglobus sp.]
MSPITRTWVAFAAVGTGLIHVALVLGSPLPLGIALAVLGLAEFFWGVLTFARDAPPAPRIALAVAVVPLVALGLFTVVAVAGGFTIPSGFLLPLGLATLLEVAAAALLGRALRTSGPAPAPGVGRYLIALFAGAVVVGAITTPALAATTAGANAVPHGEFHFEQTDHGH